MKQLNPKTPSSPMKSHSRQGKLAEGKTHVIFVSSIELKGQLQRMAAAEKRTLSNFLDHRLTRLVSEEGGAAC